MVARVRVRARFLARPRDDGRAEGTAQQVRQWHAQEGSALLSKSVSGTRSLFLSYVRRRLFGNAPAKHISTKEWGSGTPCTAAVNGEPPVP